MTITLAGSCIIIVKKKVIILITAPNFSKTRVDLGNFHTSN